MSHSSVPSKFQIVCTKNNFGPFTFSHINRLFTVTFSAIKVEGKHHIVLLEADRLLIVVFVPDILVIGFEYITLFVKVHHRFLEFVQKLITKTVIIG
jgi:hypothetical protein